MNEIDEHNCVYCKLRTSRKDLLAPHTPPEATLGGTSTPWGTRISGIEVPGPGAMMVAAEADAVGGTETGTG